MLKKNDMELSKGKKTKHQQQQHHCVKHGVNEKQEPISQEECRGEQNFTVDLDINYQKTQNTAKKAKARNESQQRIRSPCPGKERGGQKERPGAAVERETAAVRRRQLNMNIVCIYDDFFGKHW